MVKPFFNRNIGITSDDILICNDVVQLKELLMLIDLEISSVKVSIENLTNEDVYDTEKVRGMKIYLMTQNGLRTTIVNRLGVVKSKYGMKSISAERDFWKEKVQYLVPKKMDEYYKEVEALRDEAYNAQ